MLSRKRWDRPHDPLEVRALLVASRSEVAAPERWCKVFNAVNEAGRDEDPRSVDARRFCALGAVVRNDPSIVGRRVGPLGRAALEALDDAAIGLSANLAHPSHSCVDLNDNAQHKDVVRMFDIAIAMVTSLLR